MLVPSAEPPVNQAERTVQMGWGASLGNTGAHCPGRFQAPSSCTHLSPRTLGCRCNVIIAERQTLPDSPSSPAAFSAKASLLRLCLRDKIQSPDLLLWGGGGGALQVTRAEDPLSSFW